MDRRRFIGVASAAVATALAAGCDAGAGHDSAALARPELLAALGADAVRGIGATYRAVQPNEPDAASLRAAIFASRPWTARLPWSRRLTIGQFVQSDFADGRTIVVQGWVLSETEARQCALYSLLPA